MHPFSMTFHHWLLTYQVSQESPHHTAPSVASYYQIWRSLPPHALKTPSFVSISWLSWASWLGCTHTSAEERHSCSHSSSYSYSKIVHSRAITWVNLPSVALPALTLNLGPFCHFYAYFSQPHSWHSHCPCGTSTNPFLSSVWVSVGWHLTWEVSCFSTLWGTPSRTLCLTLASQCPRARTCAGHTGSVCGCVSHCLTTW